MTTTNRLATIADRQRKSRVRDVLFAAGITLATALALASLSSASTITPTAHVAHR